MKKNILIAVLLMVAGAVAAFMYVNFNRQPKKTVSAQKAEFCARHQISESNCPWCDPSLIEKMGMCVGHDVPEALCSRCNTLLIAGFKAEGDWCAGHNLPESQCKLCQAGHLPPGEK